MVVPGCFSQTVSPPTGDRPQDHTPQGCSHAGPKDALCCIIWGEGTCKPPPCPLLRHEPKHVGASRWHPAGAGLGADTVMWADVKCRRRVENVSNRGRPPARSTALLGRQQAPPPPWGRIDTYTSVNILHRFLCINVTTNVMTCHTMTLQGFRCHQAIGIFQLQSDLMPPQSYMQVVSQNATYLSC